MNYQLYRLCRYFFRIALRFFFRKIEVKGRENLPAKGPVIIVANHAASFLDPIVIASILRFPVFFIAKARFLSRPLPVWFLRIFNVIPVYRSQDDPSLMDKNQKSFEACFKHLNKGGSIIIFPEGISHSIRQLMKIKTGAARIALGASTLGEAKTRIEIVPIGLNYSNQEKFQSKLFISVGETIPVEEYVRDYVEDDVKGVNTLTQKIEETLNKNIINAGDERRDNIARRVEKLMKSRILEDWGVKKEELQYDHKVNQRILLAMNYLHSKNPVRYAELEREANEYFERVRDIDMPETIFISKRLSGIAIFFYFLYFLPGFPLHLAGLVGNFIPYQFSVYIARGWSRSKEYRGAAGFVAGIIVFVAAYYVEFLGLKQLTSNTLLSIGVIVSMPFLGIFSFYYWRKLRRFYYKVIFSYAKKRIFVRRLIARRNNIINELEKVRQEFLEAEKLNMSTE